jgi:hypothetical protein
MRRQLRQIQEINFRFSKQFAQNKTKLAAKERK